ncbi:MAG: metallophosphoesterase family protein [Thermodesulfobacteriota bacterium]
MKIGVISDTHMHQPDEPLFNLVKTVFADVEMILHAGDLTRIAVLEAFSGKEVVAVCGNMDQSDVATRLQDREMIHVSGYRIGLIHGWGGSAGIEDRIRKLIPNAHAIVYGHTHRPSNHEVDGTLMFNPGAYSGSFLFGVKRSVGILTIGETISGEIVHI